MSVGLWSDSDIFLARPLLGSENLLDGLDCWFLAFTASDHCTGFWSALCDHCMAAPLDIIAGENLS